MDLVSFIREMSVYPFRVALITKWVHMGFPRVPFQHHTIERKARSPQQHQTHVLRLQIAST